MNADSKPADGQNEIIDVGWALLEVPSSTLMRTGTITVKPILNSRVSKLCVQLTIITQEMVDAESATLKETFDFLVDELGSRICRGRVMDKKMSRLPSPFGKAYTDIKALFKGCTLNTEETMGWPLCEAVLGKQIEETHHSGGADAINIAVMLGELLKMREPSVL